MTNIETPTDDEAARGRGNLAAQLRENRNLLADPELTRLLERLEAGQYGAVTPTT
ncbi:hypothetical protein [Mycobacteroides abscessus]|uniref:hypothetical protein n=1 Tax=Mycobacteroides abscessus TaxID=36809 RepID=UPI00266F41F6|nr:hypothetical protein [Mycobacteroides abscessus]MDO3110491.1 hypothetical protein [Mycobacteroides abscessus subsp. abscessus]